MNVSLKVKRIDLQFIGQNLQVLNQYLTRLDIDGVSIMFYRAELEDLYLKLARKARTTTKPEVKINIRPAAAYVIYKLWLAVPKSIFIDLPLMYKITGAIDKNGASYQNPFNSNFKS